MKLLYRKISNPSTIMSQEAVAAIVIRVANELNNLNLANLLTKLVLHSRIVDLF